MPSAPRISPAAPVTKTDDNGNLVDDGSNWTRAEINAYNAEALAIYNEDALIKCPKSGRTFTKAGFVKQWIGNGFRVGITSMLYV